jgi:hypothetical protein
LAAVNNLKEDADEADKSVNSTVTKTEITSESKAKIKNPPLPKRRQLKGGRRNERRR